MAEAAGYVGMSKSSYTSHQHKPAPIPLGARARGYLREDLDAMVDRLAGRVIAPPTLKDWSRPYG